MRNGKPVMLYQAAPAKIMIRLLFIIAFLSLPAVAQKKLQFGQIAISINDIPLNVEFADTTELRNRGLMYRESMCGDCGMLFRFSYAKPASMWMKNTLIPLDVAFIKSNGEISDIKAMQPHDLTSVGASTDVLFALEMNQGWFAKNGIKVGDVLIVDNNN